MSTDGKPVTPEQVRELEAIRRLMDDGPLGHSCQVCGTEAQGTFQHLPVGWRWMALGEGWETIEEVDNDTKLLCAFCVARLEKALEDSRICGKK